MTEPSTPPTSDPPSVTKDAAQNVAQNDATGDAPAPLLRIRYRIRFGKTDLLRWTGHRDMLRLWERTVRRAGLKLSMTEGFNPKPRLAFPSALTLGVEGHQEVLELDLAEEMSVQELFDRLCEDNQPGLTIKSVKRLPEGFGKAQLQRSDYIITIPESVDISTAEQEITQLKSQDTLSFERKKKTVTVDASQISAIEIVGNELHLSLAASESASLRPGDVLDLIKASDWIENGALVSRTEVLLQKEFETDNPELITSTQSAASPPSRSPAKNFHVQGDSESET